MLEKAKKVKIQNTLAEPERNVYALSPAGKVKRALISGFIAFYLIAIFCWGLPLNTLLRAAINDAISPYMRGFGLWQGWDMFAPNPRTTNLFLEAEITYRNGQRRTWRFPQMHGLGLFERAFKERYRKWANDHVRLDTESALWPDTARYIARLNSDASNPPQSVRLIRYWSDIPRPTTALGQPQPPVYGDWYRFVFFTYLIAPGDLS